MKEIGAALRVLQCPEHGRYKGSVLSVEEHDYVSRCPECRDDDERLQVEHLRGQAFDLLANLGRLSMRRERKRHDGDREFFIRLFDQMSNARVAVGNFWAGSETEAIGMAEKEFPGLFSNLGTHTWKAHAELLPVKHEEVKV